MRREGLRSRGVLRTWIGGSSRGRGFAARAKRSFAVETLETRQMLAANPIVSEFVADNNNSLADGDGRASDWIEIYNAGDAAIDLAGWHLTDDAAAPTKWTFPSKTLAAGEFLVVFASTPTDPLGNVLDDYVDAGGNLHTNFSLNDTGEYLAFVRPDLSVASAFAPEFPAQRQDVAYGIAQGAIFTTLVDSGSAGTMLVPTASIGNAWTGGNEPFDDATWQSVTLGVGYDEDQGPVTTLTNVALGKAVTQSTNGFGFNGSLAVDGNRTGNSISHTNTGDLEPWMEINLGADYEIERIDVYTRDNCCTPPVGASPERDYNLVVEVRDANNVVLHTSTPFNPWNGTGTATIVGVGASFSVDLTGEVEGGITGRKVRVRKTAFGGTNHSEWLHLAEVEVYAVTETTPVEQNLALGKPTSGQVAFGFPTANAVDGNTGNITHTENVGAVFWQVDLQAATDLGRVELVNRSDGCCPERLNGAVLSVLDANQQVIYTAEPFGDAGVGQVFTFDNAGGGFPGARYIRVDHNNQYLSIAEVRAFAPQGYATLIATDVETAVENVNSSAYVRSEFDVADPSAFDQLTMSLNYDDGFVAYLNGVEFARANAPAGTPNYLASATGAHAGGLLESFGVPVGLLHAGTNVLAIHGLNASVADADFLLRPRLVAREVPTGAVGFLLAPTPGEPNGATVDGFVEDTAFSVDRGFFETAFDVQIASPTPGATIVYTKDGSAPTLTNGTVVPPPDANSPPTATVPITTTTTLRAAAFKTGLAPTNVDTQTYIFLQDVIHQPANPAGFPSVWADPAQATISADYEMDPDVVNNPSYSDEILQGLRDIPTISIVMDPEDLFGSQRGIYTNSSQRGSGWERPTSVEILDPSGNTYQGDAGIRIHGFSWRFHANSPKHGFRLEFSSEYGPSKLEYPLFPDSPATKFDSIVLRQQGGRAWAGLQNPAEAQYLRDTYARDLAREMGKFDGHATLVHLYLNGLYWGLYNPVERPDANMAEEYFGGTEEDYDALNRRTSTNEVIDGDLVRYNAMIAIADAALAAGTTTNAQLAELERYVDMEDFIDHLILNQYVTNRDGITAFDGNNQRAIGSRVGDPKFRFFVWDMEYSMWNATDNIHVCQGCNNPAQAGGQNPPASFWTVFKALAQHPEFRLRYADRVHEHLFNDGALTPAKAAATWEVRAESIERAIIGESARWGDSRRATPYTRDVEWQAERNRLLTTYFPQRAGILTSQLQAAGLYTAVGAPEFYVDGAPQHGGEVTAGDQLTMRQMDQVSFIDTTLIGATTPAVALVPTLAIHNAIGTTWRNPAFVPGSGGITWLSGTNGVGYDLDTNPATNYDSRINIDVQSQMSGTNGNTSVYVRIPFNLPNQAAIDAFDFLTLRMLYDDGFVAYLNGVKVASATAPADASLTWNSGATAGGEASLNSPVVFDLTAFRNQLVVGQNVLAIHGLNAGNTSSDMLVWAELLAREIDTTPTSTPIYYTTDGSDPRLFGGAISPTATLYQGAIPLAESVNVRARALSNGAWSALSETTFSVDVPLRVSEIMYNPNGPGDELEFIELVNASAFPVSLSGVRFAGDIEGIEFTFDASEPALGGGEHIVVARDRAAFEAAYDTVGIRLAIGQFAGGQQLSNAGETLTLVDAAGALVQTFTYNDAWFGETDGDGFSLVPLDTAGNYDLPANWRSSALALGSPGRADPTPAAGDFNGDGTTNRADAALLSLHFGRTVGSHRGRGDFDLDGDTDLADLAGLQRSLGSQVASPAASAAVVVAARSARAAAHDAALAGIAARGAREQRPSATRRVLRAVATEASPVGADLGPGMADENPSELARTPTIKARRTRTLPR